jgi:hypothetical protein
MALVQSSKFLVMHESIAGHVGINGVCHKLGKGNTTGSMVGPRWDLEMLLL